MTMWEYRYAWGRNGHIYTGIAGEKQAVAFRDYISTLGRDGWELCCSLPERDGYVLVFKRQTHE